MHIYEDPPQSIEVRVQDLLSRMTIKEKIDQLNQKMLGVKYFCAQGTPLGEHNGNHTSS